MLQDWQSINISEDQLITKTYSPLLKMVVTALCEVDLDDRVRAIDIFRWLQPYDSDISNLKPFTATPPPLKAKFFRKEERAPLNMIKVPLVSSIKAE